MLAMGMAAVCVWGRSEGLQGVTDLFFFYHISGFPQRLNYRCMCLSIDCLQHGRGGGGGGVLAVGAWPSNKLSLVVLDGRSDFQWMASSLAMTAGSRAHGTLPLVLLEWLGSLTPQAPILQASTALGVTAAAPTLHTLWWYIC